MSLDVKTKTGGGSVWVRWLTWMFLVSVLTILKNPMILMGLASMVMFIGMPYIMKNSTPPSPLRS